jgi:E1A/CREB-binding protein
MDQADFSKTELKEESASAAAVTAAVPLASGEPIKTDDDKTAVTPAASGAASAITKNENYVKQKAVFSAEELRTALMPPLEKMYNQEPEAAPFRSPVDPGALGIPDYFEIIKKPMDMSAIKRKLDTGAYTDPWEFINDVFLMFENAWVYNRKTSRVYRYCTKVSVSSSRYQSSQSRSSLYSSCTS